MIDSTAKKLPLGTLPTCGEELCRLPGRPAWSTVSLPNTRGGQARRIILRAPTMDACAHEYTTARARADTGDRRRPSQADRPSAATRNRHRLPHRAVGRRCRRDPLSAAPARRRVPGVWLGWVRPRAGPAVSGAVSGGGAPRARYLGCLLCRRPPRGEGDQPLLGLRSSRTPPQRRLRAPRKVPRLPPFSPQTFLALLCFPTTCSVKCCSHGKGEKTRLLFSGLRCCLPRLWCWFDAELLVRWRWEQFSSLIGVSVAVRGIKALSSCSRRRPGPCP